MFLEDFELVKSIKGIVFKSNNEIIKTAPADVIKDLDVYLYLQEIFFQTKDICLYQISTKNYPQPIWSLLEAVRMFALFVIKQEPALDVEVLKSNRRS